MSVLLSIALAATQPLPFIDRAALHAQARFEAARDARPVSTPMSRERRLAELCAAAGPHLETPAPVWRAHAMSAPKVSILETSCAAHRRSATSVADQTASRRTVRAGGTPPLRAR